MYLLFVFVFHAQKALPVVFLHFLPSLHLMLISNALNGESQMAPWRKFFIYRFFAS